MTDPYNPDGNTVRAVACAQPATVHDPLPQPGALSISFPDGPVPEIKYPRDCYLNNNLRAGDIDLLTPNVGDYPTDVGSLMQLMTWPVATTAKNTSNAWQCGLHDWIRRAGTKANIDSVLNMQNALLDPPVPDTATWISPVVAGGPYVPIGDVSAGIIHIFKFDPDGVVTYQSRLLTPYPLYVSSHEQMYVETMQALPNSSIGTKDHVVPMPDGNKTIVMMKVWDVYIRDEVRNPGTINGGKHAGEPIAKPLVAQRHLKSPILTAQLEPHHTHISTIVGRGSGACTSCTGGPLPGGPTGGAPGGTGKGYPPLITPQTDTGELMTPASPFVPSMPPKTQLLRPFYQACGTAVDIRFRRQVNVKELKLKYDVGYVGTTTAP